MCLKPEGSSHLSLVDRFPKLKEIIQQGKLPNHVFIIPDGNLRWVQRAHGALAVPIIGHRSGANVVQSLLRDLRELPIPFVTLWGFSVDNWGRGQQEINDLMSLSEEMIKANLDELHRSNVKFVHLGRKDRIKEKYPTLLQTIVYAEDLTSDNAGQVFSLAIDFGGEDQMVRMMQKVQELPQGTLITPEIARSLRDGGGLIPSADLIIRTSGEMRLSDVGWINGARTEIWTTPKLLPDLKTDDIVAAIVDFSGRQRRFGGRPTSPDFR